MSIALVVTRGYGTGTLTGSISDVVLRGYAIGEVVEAEQVRRGGGPLEIWETRPSPWQRRDAARRRLERALREAYLDATGQRVPVEAQEQAFDLLRAFAAPEFALAPYPVDAIDFDALAADTARARRSLLALRRIVDEEAAAVLLLL